MLIVSELSKAAQTTPDTIRYYVRIGLLIPYRDHDNGYKLFDDDDIKKVKFIRRAKGLGFTLRDIQTIFDHSNAWRSPCQRCATSFNSASMKTGAGWLN